MFEDVWVRGGQAGRGGWDRMRLQCEKRYRVSGAAYKAVKAVREHIVTCILDFEGHMCVRLRGSVCVTRDP